MKRALRVLAVYFSLMLVVGTATSQTIEWESTFPASSGAGNDRIPDPANGRNALAVDSAGNSVSVTTYFDGISDNLRVRKYGPDGTTMFERTIDLGGLPETAIAVATDAANDVFVLADAHLDDLVYSRGALFKLDADDGEVNWIRHTDLFQFTFPSSFPLLKIDAAGDVIVSGYDTTKLVIAKYSGSSGSMLWSRSHEGNPNDHFVPLSILVEPGGDILLSAANGGVYYLWRHDGLDGTVEWTNDEFAPESTLALSASGNLLALGRANSSWRVAGYSLADGSQVFSTPLAEDSCCFGHHLVTDESGDAFAVVSVSSPTSGGLDVVAARLSGTDGTIVWLRTMESRTANSVAVAPGSGIVLLAGSRVDAIRSSDGSDVWGQALDTIWSRAVSMKVNANQVSILARSGSGSELLYLQSFATATGVAATPIWFSPNSGFATTAGCTQRTGSLAPGLDGSLYVPTCSYDGNPTNSSSGWFAALTKLDAAGNKLWHREFFAGEHRAKIGDYRVDADGNIVLATFGPQYDVVDLFKLSGVTGAELWHNRLQHHSAYFRLELNANGDALLVSQIFPEQGLYVAKLATADGQLVWDRSYEVAASTTFRLRAAVQAGNELLVVNGNSYPAAGAASTVVQGISTSTSDVDWRRDIPVLDFGSQTGDMFTDASTVYLVMEQRRVALALSDGSDIWVHDNFANYVSVVGQTPSSIITLDSWWTSTKTLRSFSKLDGASQWVTQWSASRTSYLHDADVVMCGHYIGFPYRGADVFRAAWHLDLIDATNGNFVTRVIQSEAPADEAYLGDVGATCNQADLIAVSSAKSTPSGIRASVTSIRLEGLLKDGFEQSPVVP